MSALRTLALLATTAAAVATAACAADAPTAPASSARRAVEVAKAEAKPERASADVSLDVALADARVATARYHRVEAALADGYESTHECVAIPGAGMGVHYVNGARLADGVVDPTRPEALLYEPTGDGGLRLVGVEYITFRAPWDAAHPAPPTLAGVPFDESFGEHAHGLPDHYELHAWVWRHNPAGMFAPFNPNVTCPADVRQP